MFCFFPSLLPIVTAGSGMSWGQLGMRPAERAGGDERLGRWVPGSGFGEVFVGIFWVLHHDAGWQDRYLTEEVNRGTGCGGW